MLIQIHMLQNYGPANLNRDDTGAPKDTRLGGVQRGRISSQCLKRSIRKSATFAEAFEEGQLALRTKRLPHLIKVELEALGADAAAVKAIVARIPDFGRESTKKGVDETEDDEEGNVTEGQEAPETETKQLIFLGKNELRPLAEKLLALYNEYGDAKKWERAKITDITKVMGKSVPRSVDVAMFGRMTTSEAFEDVQAAVQVAHAISTNTLVEEFDYYTAVDDLSGQSGAGMIGDVEYNCSTYYKYLNVHWEQLVENLGNDVEAARLAVLALLEAAVTAQPTGKQNSFAAHYLPDLVLAEVRTRNLPINYANAFLKPARGTNQHTVMDDSAAKLSDYMARVSKVFGLDADRRAMISLQDYTLPSTEACPSLAEIKTWLAQQLLEG